jgi:lysophospholipase L1-like esterase
VSQREQRDDQTLGGLCVHISLWTLLCCLVVFLGRGSLFPGKPQLSWVLLLTLLAIVVALWASRRTRTIAVMALNVVSLAGLVVVLAEVTLTAVKPREVAVTRFPYPFRMHGAAPRLQTGQSHLGMTTNDSGLRDSETVPRKVSDELRIVVLGGSAVLGAGVADDETAPHRLEGLLAQRLDREPLDGVRTVRVINAGQGYYNSTQELVFLVTELAIYEPDVIVVADGYNDLHHAVVWGNRPPANEVTSAMLEDLMHGGGTVRRVGWPDAVYTALQASYLGNRTRGGIASSVIAPAGLGFPVDRPRGTKRDPHFLPLVQHRLVMNWTLMHRLAASFGARAIFSLQPTIFVKQPLADEEREYIETTEYSRLASESWRELERFVDDEAARLGLPVFRADAYIRDHPERLFADYCHLFPQGNRLMARAMADRIDEELSDWPWGVSWDGVRFSLADGDPIWRPERLGRRGEWR